MPVTIAIEPYDRHLPLVERAWCTTSGVPLEFRLVGQLAPQQHGRDRHERFLNGDEFDAAELSLSSYLMYRQRHEDVIALPIFPRRLFSFSNVWVRHDSEATCWADLVASVIGAPTFQMSLGIVARQDMAEVEGVAWTSMDWVTSHPENVTFEAPVRRLVAPSLADALATGEVQAIVTPEIPSDPSFRQGARRLFGSRAKTIELEQLRTRGYAPIMHVLAVRTSVLERDLDLAQELIDVFSRAQEVARERYNDPGWSLTFWSRQEVEQQEDVRGPDCWVHGLEPNRRNLQDFCDAATAQGILRQPADLDALFAT